jgi:iron complex transport system substrate-binding protein
MRGLKLIYRLKFLWLFVGTLMLINTAVAQDSCAKIVSLAPSITEVLFDLGLGDRIVGATRFCRYPLAARELPKVGGYLDVNLEEIISKRPNVVFSLKEGENSVKSIERFGIDLLSLNHSSLSGIKESYSIIADRCGITDKAKERLAQIQAAEDRISAKCKSVSQSSKKRVLVIVGRTREGSKDTGFYISGSDGFYNDILEVLGAVNVHQGGTAAIPTVSAEGLLKLDPDFIIDILNVDDNGEAKPSTWLGGKEGLDPILTKLPAVARGDVLVLSADYASIPGPRYLELLDVLAHKFHEAALRER